MPTGLLPQRSQSGGLFARALGLPARCGEMMGNRQARVLLVGLEGLVGAKADSICLPVGKDASMGGGLHGLRGPLGCPLPLGWGDCLRETDISIPSTLVHLKLCSILHKSPRKYPEKSGEARGPGGGRPGNLFLMSSRAQDGTSFFLGLGFPRWGGGCELPAPVRVVGKT